MFDRFSEEDLRAITGLAKELVGTSVSAAQHAIIIQNIGVRIAATKCKDLGEYLALVEQDGEEISYLISALTIHTTSWFREPGAFKQLGQIVDEVCRASPGPLKFSVLSIACSTGEEVYSLAALLESVRARRPGLDYSVEGWDIDPISLRSARQAVYRAEAFGQIPPEYKSIIVQREPGRGESFTVAPTIQSRCRFRTVNIARPPGDVESFDFIICRNMLIYFESEDVAKILSYIKSHVKANGHICVGVSETSAVAGLKFRSLGAAVYAIGVSPSTKTSAPSRFSKRTGDGILVVDDEPDLREIMLDCLREAGYSAFDAADGDSALAIIKQRDISLVVSDYAMPGMNGLNLCKAARSHGYRGPFIIVSGHADTKMVQNASLAGCTDVVLKPLGPDELVRLANSHIGGPLANEFGRPDLILVGASTGGTEVLVRMLAKLPEDSPPVMVVQHIASAFASEFAMRLAKAANLRLADMQDGELIRPGRLYMALDDYHIGVRKAPAGLKLAVSNQAPVGSHRPSVDFLFNSVADMDCRVFAALLTGMGKDGAAGLLRLREGGGETLAQDEKSCAVFGMPKEAIRLKAAVKVGNPTEIRQQLDERLKAASMKRPPRRAG